jgi:hypothetical protein
MAVRNGMWDTVLMCLRVRVFNIIYRLTPKFDTTHMANYIRFATITRTSLHHLPANIYDMGAFNKAASQLMSMQCAIASTHISCVDMYHAAPLKWPPRSPDLNPCDFWLWLWRMVKADVYVTKLHDINTEGGKKDHCCHPRNSSACVCVCVCVQLP